ncbi:MAG: hypothetical protein FWF14_02075, partial [Streptococcaceae bacterium]|nr:hypothetical protein [Streptococcaceae bacterium]
MITSMIHSLIISLIATLIAFLLMVMPSYWGAYRSYRGKWLIEVLLLLPLVLPPTVVGYYLLQAFGAYGLFGKALNTFNFSIIFTLAGAILATTIIILPFMYQGLKSAFL